MSPSEMFWKQLGDAASEYGLILVVSTLIIGIIIGNGFHLFLNVLPARNAEKEMKKTIQEPEEEESVEEIEEDDRNPVLPPVVDFMRKSNLKGRINTNLLNQVKRCSFVEPSKENEQGGLPEAMKQMEEEKQSLIGGSKEDKAENNEADSGTNDSDNDMDLVDVENESRMSGKMGLKEKEDAERRADMFARLPELHGKLATAQLRAKTRHIQLQMSDDERKTEAEMKREQLASIMALMLKEKEKFGMDNEDLQEQLQLYNF